MKLENLKSRAAELGLQVITVYEPAAETRYAVINALHTPAIEETATPMTLEQVDELLTDAEAQVRRLKLQQLRRRAKKLGLSLRHYEREDAFILVNPAINAVVSYPVPMTLEQTAACLDEAEAVED